MNSFNVINTGTQVIETERLHLRKFVIGDAEEMFTNWMNDKEIQFNYGEPVYETLDLVKEVLRGKCLKVGSGE